MNIRSTDSKRRHISLSVALFVMVTIALSAELSLNIVTERTLSATAIHSTNEIGRSVTDPIVGRSMANASERATVYSLNGRAYRLEETEDAVKFVPVRTSQPVFKAFSLTSDGQKLLYIAMKRGAPTGELILEDLELGKARKLTTRLVLTAAMSPLDDNQIAFTYASGNNFGLEWIDVRRDQNHVLVDSDVYAEYLQWSDTGDGIHFFDTSIKSTEFDLADPFSSGEETEKIGFWNHSGKSTSHDSESLTLTQKFAYLTTNVILDSSSKVPFGFPELKFTSEQGHKLFSKRTSAAIAPNKYPFQFAGPTGETQLVGDNLIGIGNLAITVNRTGESLFWGRGQIIKVVSSGLFLRNFTNDGTELEFVDWNGKSQILGISLVNYHLPAQSSVVMQGGAGYTSPGNCNLSAHGGSFEFAYDFQTAVVGSHALASADGLVVFAESSYVCNSVQPSCPDYVSGGCPGQLLGNTVIILHSDGTYSKYSHMEPISPQTVVGTIVDRGLYIGRQGHTGATGGTFNSCGDHLHFQRQSSPDIFGQSLPVDFADVVSEPLSCGTNYVSGSTEISHSISTSSQSFGISGGSASVDVTSTGGTWSVTPSQPWITINDAGTGVGNYSVAYSVGDNSSGGPRSGSINIGGKVLTVTQSGSQPQNLPPTVDAGVDISITLPASSNLNGIVSDDGLPNPPAALTTTWTKVSGPGSVVFGNPNVPVTTANINTAGVYVLRLSVADGEIVIFDDVRVTVNVTAGGGALIGSRATPPSNVNLTIEGTTDWSHWGLTNEFDFNHKNGVTQQISNFANIGSISQLRYTNNPTSFSWTDGTPTVAAGSTTGVYKYDVGNGFQLTVPADTTARTLRLYVGLFAATGRLEAEMSDGSASPYVDTSMTSVAGVNSAVYTIDFQSSTAGQTLTLRWTVEQSFHPVGNVTLQAASLETVIPPTPTPTPSPTPTPTPTPTPVNQAPTVVVGGDQVVTLPSTATLIGNVTDDGLPSVPGAVTSVWSQTSGPGTVSFGNTNSASTTATFSLPGLYVLRLTVDDGEFSAFDELTFVVNDVAASGVLTASVADSPANVDLSAGSPSDWAHWGLNNPATFNQKSSVVSQISNITMIGSNPKQQVTGNATAFSWNDGTPTAIASNTGTGVWVIGLNNGFQLTVPADPIVRTLKLYVGAWSAQGRIEVTSSEPGSTGYVDTFVTSNTPHPRPSANAVYTMSYRSATPGQTLTIKWTANAVYDGFGFENVTLQAAHLSEIVPIFHNVTYAAGGGSGTAPVQSPVAEGASFIVAANSFTRAGYTFTGWSDGSNIYQPNDLYTIGTADVTLSAQWIFDNSRAISGNIQQYNAPSANTPLGGVSVGITGGSPVGTDPNGNFSFAGLIEGANYTITPTLAGYTFDPSSRTYTNLTADQTAADFIAYAGGTPRVIKAVSQNIAQNAQAVVPVTMISQGNEHGIAFSLAYDPNVLSNPAVVPGDDCTGCTVTVSNTTGQIGISTVRPGNTVFIAGTAQVVRITFDTTATAPAYTGSALTFGDTPTARLVSNASADPFTAAFTNGVVTFALGNESRLTSRFDSDYSGPVVLTDYIQAGRFAVGLDQVNPLYNELQRADASPRATLGDGLITAADYVQAGRYAAGIDNFQPAGGTTFANLFSIQDMIKEQEENQRALLPRIVSAVDTSGYAGLQAVVSIRIDAEGDENGFGFTISYDATKLSNPVVTTGADMPFSGPFVNTNTPGKVGVITALSFGATIPAGAREIVKVQFNISPTAPGGQTPITFTGAPPVVNQVSSATATALPTTFTSGTVTILTPSAAETSVGGIVVSSEGQPVRNSRLTLTDQSGVIRTAVSNSFGFFRFDDVAVGETYVLIVHAKGNVFAPQIVNVTDEVTNLLVVAETPVGLTRNAGVYKLWMIPLQFRHAERQTDSKRK